jgi:hypothetical protein
MLSDVIISLLITSTTNVLYAIIKNVAKSKCSECSFIGCCKIKRDVALEEKENEFEITHQQPGCSPTREEAAGMNP